MRALQALVIVMGIMLLAGSAVVAVTIMHRLSDPAHHAAAADPPPTLPPRVTVVLPEGTHVADIAALGQRLALHVTGRAGDAILIVDPASGAVLETMSLTPSPSANP